MENETYGEKAAAIVRRRPTGFVARCQCGKMTGALDYLRTSKKEAGEILGLWLAEGRTVEPRFSGTWVVDLETCVCVFPDPNDQTEAREE